MVVPSSKHSVRSIGLLKTLIDDDSSNSRTTQTTPTRTDCEQWHVLGAETKLWPRHGHRERSKLRWLRWDSEFGRKLLNASSSDNNQTWSRCVGRGPSDSMGHATHPGGGSSSSLNGSHARPIHH